jgi:hypothetical protein
MGSPRTDFDLLLAAPDPIEAELARGILHRAGIPSYLHGQDRGFSAFGCAGHRLLTRPDLYVPRGMRERARAVLEEIGERRPLADEGTGDESLRFPDAPRAGSDFSLLDPPETAD